jgi:hypothetical protein
MRKKGYKKEDITDILNLVDDWKLP